MECSAAVFVAVIAAVVVVVAVVYCTRSGRKYPFSSDALPLLLLGSGDFGSTVYLLG